MAGSGLRSASRPRVLSPKIPAPAAQRIGGDKIKQHSVGDMIRPVRAHKTNPG